VDEDAMKSSLIALAAAFGLLCAVAETGFAEQRGAPAHSGKIKDKVKRSLPLRTERTPEVHGGTLDTTKGAIIYF
jgi:hypothetical protein